MVELFSWTERLGFAVYEPREHPFGPSRIVGCGGAGPLAYKGVKWWLMALSAIWVYVDARRWGGRPARVGDTGSRDPREIMPPALWLICSLLLWLVFVPFYMKVTGRLQRV